MTATRRPLVPKFDRDGLCLLESRHAVDFRMEWTKHPFLKVITTLRGSGRVEFRSGAQTSSYGLSLGKVAAIYPDTEHRLSDLPGEPMLIYILCVGKDFPLSINLPSQSEGHFIEDPGRAAKALQILKQIGSHAVEPGIGESGISRRLSRCGLTALLLSQLLDESSAATDGRQPRDSAARVKAFLERLSQDFFRPRSVNEAAAETRLSRRRFTQLFLQLAGETYSRHLERLRVNHACRLLRERQLSPLTVAFQVGYEDASTFYRAFKKRTGLTPARWMGTATGEG